MRIGQHDTDERVLLVAEIGINHNGSLATAIKLQEAAAEYGADAVKYQVGNPHEYVNRDLWYRPKETPWGTIEAYVDYRSKLEFDYEQLRDLKAHANSLGLIWFASPLDVDAVDLLEELGVPAYKIASPMITDRELISACLSTWKPILLSSGMSTWQQIKAAVALADDYTATALLHCTSTYPCPPSQNNLRMITTMREQWPHLTIGYSGHEKGIPESVAAVALGARIIERHFTLDRGMKGSDHGASLEPGAFRKMRDYIRTVEEALGTGRKDVHLSEIANAEKFRKYRNLNDTRTVV